MNIRNHAERAAAIRGALATLRHARRELLAAGARQAAAAALRAIRSTDGARRHAMLAPEREERQRADRDAMEAARTCVDCGTRPEPRSDCVGRFAWFGRGRRKRPVCIPCAERRERAAFAKARRYFGYLSSDGARVTCFPGGELARVVRETTGRNGGAFGSGHWGTCARTHARKWFGATTTYVRAVAPDGSEWAGRGPGRGMFLRLRRIGKKLPAPAPVPAAPCAAAEPK